MTKKSKAPIAGEIVEAVPENEDVLGFNDVPFIRKQPRDGVREYQHDPKHEPIVEIAGKVRELKEVDMATVLRLMDGSHHISSSEDLIQSNRAPHSSIARWQRSGPITLKDITFKHVRVDGVDIYISNGSELIITDSLDPGYYHGEITDKRNSSIILLLSRANTKNLSVLGKNTFTNSSLTVGESVTLIDAGLTNSSIGGNAQSLTVDDSTVVDSLLYVDKFTTITDSHLNGLHISGLSTVTFDRVIGGRDFTLSFYSRKSKEVGLSVTNQQIHGLNYHNGVSNTDGYKPLDDFPCWGDSLTLNIEKRTDYGYFSAVKPIPFVRLNQFDLLVGGEVFSVKDFLPELVDENAQRPTPVTPPANGPFGEYSRPGGYYTPPLFSSTPGYWTRSSDVWKKAARIAFDTNGKKVIGKTAEMIVNSLLDQIKSRISLYVELNSLV